MPAVSAPVTSDRSGETFLAVGSTDLPLPNKRAGKVRDVYQIPATDTTPERIVLVATDRLSAFDVVLPTPVAGKGRLLTGLSGFWLRWIQQEGLCNTYLHSTDATDLPGYTPGDAGWPGAGVLDGRVTIGRACEVVPIECVVRGYLEGSGWHDYQRSGAVCGNTLPAGMARCERLETPLFTPATKAPGGAHDENIDIASAAAHIEEVAERLSWTGTRLLQWLRETSLGIYSRAAEHALERGLIIADTKFEFGIPIAHPSDTTRAETPVLIDEALTPDSSRFWPADQYEPGRTQASFDKQYVREYLEALVSAGAWNKQSPGPELPERVVEGTMARYREACARLMT